MTEFSDDYLPLLRGHVQKYSNIQILELHLERGLALLGNSFCIKRFMSNRHQSGVCICWVPF